MSLLSMKLNIVAVQSDAEPFATYVTLHSFFSPVDLWDRALQRRAWNIDVDATTSEFAVDGNSSTFAPTHLIKYPFLAVDLRMRLKIDYVVLNIKQGKLCTFIIALNAKSTITQIVESTDF